MRHIHVCLVSAQPIPNLTTIFQFIPHTVILLVTEAMKRQGERIGRLASSRGINVRTERILPYDINSVVSVCEDILENYNAQRVTLNITGGTKIGTLGAFQAFFTGGKAIFYVDTRNQHILKVSPEEETAPIDVKISIKDYLAAYGFNVHSFLKDEKSIYERRRLTEFLFDLAMRRDRLIGRLNTLLPRDVEKTHYPYQLRTRGEDEFKKLEQMMCRCNFAIKKSDGAIKLLNEDTARYLKGGWFEEYVYMMARSVGADEVKMNIEGKWDTAGKNIPKNEFDVLIAKGNRLYYISCKTANPDRTKGGEESVGKEYLYELDSISDNVLGLFGKRMLASVRPITNRYVRKRAEVLRIALHDGKNLITLKENLRNWLTAK